MNKQNKEYNDLFCEADELRRQLARYGAWEAKLLIAHQAFNVIYNCQQAPEQWERGKKLLIELRREWDEAKVTLPPAISSSDVYSSSRTEEATKKAIEAAHNFMLSLGTRDFLEFAHHDAAVSDRWKSLSAALVALDAAREGK